MTLKKIEKLLEKQSFPVIKKKPEFARQAQEILIDFGVKVDTDFYELYTKYFLTALDSRSGTSTVVDVLDRFPAEYAHEEWGIPKNYLLFTTGEGDGGYLYNTEDNTVWDFDLGQQQALHNGTLPHWNSFYEFMEWYLTIEEED